MQGKLVDSRNFPALKTVMCDNIARIQQELSTSKLGLCGKLDSENHWVGMAAMLPWDLLEPEYAHHFNNNGRPAKRFRGTLGG